MCHRLQVSRLNLILYARPRFGKKRLWLGLILLLASCISSTPNESLTTTGPLHFKETSHTVQGDFLHFFLKFGGTESLGYPLTDEIIIDGWRVQYFDMGRLEFHPENEAAHRVTVGWLGDLLHRRQPPIPASAIPRANDPDWRYFSETGHTLSGDFLTYFESYGRSVRFGRPISEPFISQGQLIQDFQSTRFIWTPGGQTPVTLENIGQTHLKTIGLKGAPPAK